MSGSGGEVSLKKILAYKSRAMREFIIELVPKDLSRGKNYFLVWNLLI